MRRITPIAAFARLAAAAGLAATLVVPAIASAATTLSTTGISTDVFTANGNVSFNDASADTIVIGQNGGTPDTVQIAGDVPLVDTNWSITAAGAATFATVNALTLTSNADGFQISGGTTARTLTVQGGNITFNATGPSSLTLPAATDTLVGRATTDTLTNKTLTAPTISGATLSLDDTGSTFNVLVVPTSSPSLTADRQLTFNVNNANRIITLTGDLTLAGPFVTTGANSITLATAGATSLTLPTSGTLTTGSGANGRVTFWNGTNALSSNANFFWDDASKALAIGHNNPTTALWVQTDTGATSNPVNLLTLAHTNTVGASATGFGTGIMFRAEDAANQQEDIATIQAAYTNATSGSEASKLQFLTRKSAGLSEAMVVDSNGDLSVNGTAITVDADNAGTATNVSIIANQGSAQDGVLRYNAAAAKWETSSNGGSTFSDIGVGTVTGTGSNGGVTFWTGPSALSTDSATFFWDNTNKRLGIGTNAPPTALTVVTSSAVANNTIPGLQIDAMTTGAPIANFGAGVMFRAEDTNGTADLVATIEAVYTDPTHTSEDSELRFFTRSAGGGLVTALTIGNTGNLTATGNISATGTVTGTSGLIVGTGGTQITRHVSFTAPIDFGGASAIVANQCATHAMDTTAFSVNVTFGDTVVIAPMADDPAWDNGQVTAFVEQANVIKAVFCADNDGADPAAVNFRVDIWRH